MASTAASDNKADVEQDQTNKKELVDNSQNDVKTDEKEDSVDNNYVNLSLDDKNEVRIHLCGATVVSWKVGGKERLFVSSLAKLDGSKAIRGGIPLVFPQFGPGAMKQHGFARVMRWNVLKKGNNYVTLTLSNVAGVTDSDPWNWKHKFRLEYCVTLLNANTMKNELKIVNLNDANNGESFNFTALFHNYFRVSDISNVKVKGLRYISELIDKVTKKNTKYENGDSGKEVEDNGFVVNQHTDRVYSRHMKSEDSNNCKGDVWIEDSGKDRNNEVIVVNKGHEMRDVVVWNPWKENSKNMGDMDDDGYLKFVCVEIGSVTKDTEITLDAGHTCVVSQEVVVAKS